ncbi:MAG: hypothetical protein JWL76_1056 [Thermoleophilia bacterium]|nr:hypothetical protein [Thermoleophilia bacterium]
MAATVPEPAIIAALVLLVALVEASPAVRLPVGLLLAIGLLASDSELLPIALLGAVGVMIARLSLALMARAGRDRLRAPSPAARAQRDALRDRLAGSPAYTRMTFMLAALPGVPAGVIFPMLGAMRAPLWPALAGTVIGRTPVLALTCALFAWLGRAASDNDDQAVVTLGMLAVLLFLFRTIGRIDWAHRAETGTWRMRDADEHMVRMTTAFGAAGPGAGASPLDPSRHDRRTSIADDDDDDVVEGEVLGEEIDDDDPDDDPPAALPPTGAAPA